MRAPGRNGVVNDSKPPTLNEIDTLQFLGTNPCDQALLSPSRRIGGIQRSESAQACAARIDVLVRFMPRSDHNERLSHSADRVDRAWDSSDGGSKQLIRARNRRPRVDERQWKRGRKNNARQGQVEHCRALRTVTLTVQRATAVARLGRVIVGGRRTR